MFLKSRDLDPSPGSAIDQLANIGQAIGPVPQMFNEETR